MSELKTNLQEILQEKQEKIIPENIKKDVQIFDVIGTLESTGAVINNQDKTITSNGLYTADEGYTGLGTVDVQVPQNVKLFDTIEEMNDDNEKFENTFAVVNKYNVKNLTETDSFNRCILPKTVVLDEPQTEYNEITFAGDGAVSAYVTLNPNGCSIQFHDDFGSMSYSYTSSDGMTYTLNDYDSDLLVILSSKMWYRPNEQGMRMWSDNIGKFITLEDYLFGGTFQCQKIIDLSSINIPDMSELSYNDYVPVFVKKDTPITVDDLLPLINKLDLNSHAYDIAFDGSHYYVMGYTKDAMSYTDMLYNMNGSPSVLMYNVEDTYNYITNDAIYKVSEDLSTVETIDRLNLPDSIIDRFGTVTSFSNTGNEFCIRYMPNDNKKLTNVSTYYVNAGGKATYISSVFSTFNKVYKLVYNYTPNQLTVNKNSVLPDVMAYGNNGVITGDGSVYSNMPDIQNKNAEIYSHTKPYANLQNIPESFFYSTATAYKNYIYLFCGGWNTSDKVYRYDVSSNLYEEWDDFSSLENNPAWGGISVSVGDYIYIFGGNSGKPGLKYNPETKEKTAITNGYNHKTLHPTPVVIGSKIYIYDGKIKCFDTLTNTWSDIWTDNIQGDIYKNYLGTDGTDLYVIRSKYNGSPNYDYTTTMTKYILSTGETSEMTDPPYGPGHAGIVSKNNKIYLFGDNDYQNEKNCYCYDVSKNSWSKLPDLPYGYYDGGYAVINNQLYLFGGDTDLGNIQGGPDSQLAYSYTLDSISNLAVPDQQELILSDIKEHLKPENIKAGVTILGVTGTLDTTLTNAQYTIALNTAKQIEGSVE